MIEIKYGERIFECPGSWEECTPDDFERLAICQLVGAAKDLNSYQYAVMAWLGLTEQEWVAFRLTYTEWKMLQAQVEWVFEPTTQKPFSGLLVNGDVWILPEAGFENCKAIELAMGFIHYLAYAGNEEAETNEEVKRLALDRLIGTFCRPRRSDLEEFRKGDEWDGDERELYNESRINDRLRALKDVPLTKKMAFLAFFQANINEFLEDYADIFGGAGGQKARYSNGMGMVMMLKDVAKQGHFGDFEQVCMQPAHLLWLTVKDDVLKQKDEKNGG